MLKGIVITKLRGKLIHNIIEYNNLITIEKEFDEFEMGCFGDIDFFILDPLINTTAYWEYMKWIKGEHPKAMIIIITTNPNYALKSFEYNLIDYVTKVNDSERIEKSFRKLLNYKNINKNNSHEIEIRTFKSFEIFVDSEYINMGNSKSTELLAFLIHNKGNTVGWEKIVENLWPQYDYEKGHNNFHSTSHKLRKKLSDYDIEYIYEVNRDSYRINTEKCKIDAIEFDDRFSNNDNMGAYSIYRGHYYDNLTYDWASYENKQYKKKYNYICEKLIFE